MLEDIKVLLAVAEDWLAGCEAGQITLVIRMALTGEIVLRLRSQATATLGQLQKDIKSKIPDCPPFKMMHGEHPCRRAAQSILDSGLVHGSIIDVVFQTASR
jgi:hypothetical protein